jgi:hypothetical protein
MTDDRLGATGRFPDGKLDEDDQGELMMSVSHRQGLVYIKFGGPVTWLAMRPSDAIELAQTLIRHAEEQDEPPQ